LVGEEDKAFRGGQGMLWLIRAFGILMKNPTKPIERILGGYVIFSSQQSRMSPRLQRMTMNSIVQTLEREWYLLEWAFTATILLSNSITMKTLRP
jgi:hypothetical protein